MLDRIQLSDPGHEIDVSQFQRSVDRIGLRPRPPTLNGRM